jgi:hypothetical protein
MQGSRSSLQADTTNLILLRGTKMDPEAVRIYLDRREYWLNYLTVSQRHWQNRQSRRRGRHHDSRMIREKYVRCVNDFYEMPSYYKGHVGS